MNNRVKTDATSWNRRTEAAPLRRAPLLLTFICLNSPASKLIRITLRALEKWETWGGLRIGSDYIRKFVPRRASWLLDLGSWMRYKAWTEVLRCPQNIYQPCWSILERRVCGLDYFLSHTNLQARLLPLLWKFRRWKVCLSAVPQYFEPPKIKASKLERHICSVQ